VKRFGLRHAFGGEGNPSQEGMAVEGTGLDAVEIAIRGGCLTLLVPADMPDSAITRLDRMTRFVRWDMELEDGSVMTITLPAGAEDLDVTITRSGEG
jgi:hypothetical protein